MGKKKNKHMQDTDFDMQKDMLDAINAALDGVGTLDDVPTPYEVEEETSGEFFDKLFKERGIKFDTDDESNQTEPASELTELTESIEDLINDATNMSNEIDKILDSNDVNEDSDDVLTVPSLGIMPVIEMYKTDDDIITITDKVRSVNIDVRAVQEDNVNLGNVQESNACVLNDLIPHFYPSALFTVDEIEALFGKVQQFDYATFRFYSYPYNPNLIGAYYITDDLAVEHNNICDYMYSNEKVIHFYITMYRRIQSEGFSINLMNKEGVESLEELPAIKNSKDQFITLFLEHEDTIIGTDDREYSAILERTVPSVISYQTGHFEEFENMIADDEEDSTEGLEEVKTLLDDAVFDEDDEEEDSADELILDVDNDEPVASETTVEVQEVEELIVGEPDDEEDGLMDSVEDAEDVNTEETLVLNTKEPVKEEQKETSFDDFVVTRRKR